MLHYGTNKMRITDHIGIAVEILKTHKMRSFLTLLGIIIGVMSIIGMQSLIQGLQKNIQHQLEALGTDTFQIQKYPVMGVQGPEAEKYRKRKNITLFEAQAIEKHCPAVNWVGPEAWRFGISVEYKNKKTSPTMHLAGGVSAFFPNNGYYIEEGRAITDMDFDQNRMVAVLGMDIVEELFPFQNPIGEKVVIDGRHYEVIGIIEKLGSRFGQSEDNRVVIPLSVFLKYYGRDRSLNITVQVEDPKMLEIAKEQVIHVLRAVRKVPTNEENDFEIWTNTTLMDSFNKTTFGIRIAALLVASCSLLVAGIGIMNIMLVSISERIREIGLRMAVGASRKHILNQFLIESIVLSQTGGLIGIFIGIGIPVLIAMVSPLPLAIPIPTIILAFFFCTLVGFIFGLYPAQKASKLDPIVALRYE